MVEPWVPELWGHSTSIVQKILLVIGFLAMCVEISIPLLIVSPQFRLILGIGTIAYTVVTVISIVVVRRKTFRYMKKEIENLQERVSSAEEASFRYNGLPSLRDQNVVVGLHVDVAKGRKGIASAKKRLILTAVWSLNKQLLVLPLSFVLTTDKIQSQTAVIVVLVSACMSQVWEVFESLANTDDE